MPLEVEVKYRIENRGEFLTRLAALSPQADGVVEQIDRYFQHPSRDFKQTDEAFRLRSVGDENRLTFKGPKIGTTTKSRLELEENIAPGAEARNVFVAMFEHLGFRTVREVRKHRERIRVEFDSRTIEVAIDSVEGLGTFVELELESDKENLSVAQQTVLSLAARLGLTTQERRSYLGMLLGDDEIG